MLTSPFGKGGAQSVIWLPPSDLRPLTSVLIAIGIRLPISFLCLTIFFLLSLCALPSTCIHYLKLLFMHTKSSPRKSMRIFFILATMFASVAVSAQGVYEINRLRRNNLRSRASKWLRSRRTRPTTASLPIQTRRGGMWRGDSRWRR